MMRSLVCHTFTNYKPSEKALGRWIRLTDVIGIPLFTFLYLFIGSQLTVLSDAAPTSSRAPSIVLASSAVFAFTTSLVLYQHCHVTPYPTEDTPEMFQVMRGIGRWIFLTRQTLCLQAIHAMLSFVSLWDPSIAPPLVALTHAMAVPVNGMGIFVMIQYYLLVASHPDFKAQARAWTARGVPFTVLMHWMHTPCGVLALIDLMLIKNRRIAIEQTPKFAALMVYYLGFVIYYLGVIHVNHMLTGQWPYGMLKDLGLDPFKWMKFTVQQFVALAIFASVAYAVVMFAPEIW